MAERDYSGIKVNLEALSAGIWGMIQEHPDGACMTLGMFPAGIMECLEKELARKIPDFFLAKGEVHSHGAEVRKEIMHDVCCEVLGLAKEAGVLLV